MAANGSHTGTTIADRKGAARAMELDATTIAASSDDSSADALVIGLRPQNKIQWATGAADCSVIARRLNRH
jgi:hypothetical protein